MNQWERRFANGKAGSRRRLLNRYLRRIFGGAQRDEMVSTHVNVPAEPDIVWSRIAFYEELEGSPPLLLRLFMPSPIRTEGDKSRAYELIRCTYDGGDLVKRIIAVEPPFRMVFEVLEQRLGIESCVIAQKGSYEINRVQGGSEVILTTQYRAFLHPRWFWLPLEQMVARRLHLHILQAVEERGNEGEFFRKDESAGLQRGATSQTEADDSATSEKKPTLVV